MSTTSSELRLGVLALQGGFAEHENHLKEATREAPLCHSSPPASEVPYTLHVTQVRNPSDLDGLDGLILPGGESTAMSVFLQQNDFALLKALKLFTASKPTWGTCAGLILLSNNVSGQMKDGQQLIGGLDVQVTRNFYGRQLASFEAKVELTNPALFDGLTQSSALFIRAPGILEVGKEATVVATYKDAVVAVQQKNLLGSTFHPELTEDSTWHRYFIKLALEYKLLR